MRIEYRPPDPKAECLCGRGEGPDPSFRLAIVCPRHDEQVVTIREPGDPGPWLIPKSPPADTVDEDDPSVDHEIYGDEE